MKGGFTFSSALVTINILCYASSTTIAYPLPAFDSSVFYVDQNTPSPDRRFTFPPFTCSEPQCCTGTYATTYEISSQNIAVADNNAYGMTTSVTFDGTNYWVAPLETSTIRSYSFYVRVTNTLGTFVYAPLKTYTVKCIASSVTFSIAWPTVVPAINSYQFIDKNTGGYVHPNLYVSDLVCPILSVRIVDTYNTAAPTSTLFDPPSCTGVGSLADPKICTSVPANTNLN